MHLFHPRLRGLTALEINVFLNQFALGMISAFGVLFIFHLNRTTLAGGVFLVMAFFAFQRVIIGLTLPLVARMTKQVGLRQIMTVGTLALAGKLILFTQIDSGLIWLLIPAAVLGGLNIAAYYPGYHAVFLDTNDDDKIGAQIGMMGFIGSLAAASTPLISGILIDSVGFSFMFLVSLVILLASIIPLWLKPLSHRKINRPEFSQVGDFYRRYPHLSAAILMWHIAEAVLVFFWPVYAFLILKNYTVLGALGSAVVLVESFIIAAAGRLYDRRPFHRLYPLIAASVTAAWAVRFLSPIPAAVFASDIIHRTVSPLWWMKIRRAALAAGETVDHLVFGLAWEWLLTAGYLIGLVTCYLLLVTFNFNWLWLALPAIGGTIGATILMKSEK
jgi:MFS family permease